MTDSKTILVVDDDPIVRLLTRNALAAEYEIVEASDGQEALRLALDSPPNLVLMDIRMPNMDGYEACRQFKSHDELQRIPVLFVSGEIGLEDRLSAYDAGGEDFISKPPNAAELRAKVSMALKDIEERIRLERDLAAAMEVAMTSMTSIGELGIVIEALRKSVSVPDLAGLAGVILDACSSYGLEACVQLRLGDEIHRANQKGYVTPVEAGVLSKLAEGDRIFSLGRQCAFNYGGTTFLVKNLPKEEGGNSDRYRDLLALIAEGADARLKVLASEARIKAQELTQSKLFEQARDALTSIQMQHVQNRGHTEQILNLMLSEMDATFPGLGLSIRQETVVSEMLRTAATKISALYAEGLGIDEHVSALDARMNVAATSSGPIVRRGYQTSAG
ncbi:hypothetical protein GCM10007907_37540 [Chitinimonas prasina]|uniref:Response regulatory domain-containing protein n=1 Tax=Chitinimonas prasina TaxID=1434937 RepID=A0ABQ5YK18_9NEIS|nr:response regulator [Chitinimonas prasina]GLR14964.1 hypothetical protein GCM10007907_37540 [Chitinimonas prasina]